MIIHFAKGVRTKNYINFMMGYCHSVQSIENAGRHVVVDGRALSEVELCALASRDGFDNVFDFLAWFPTGFKGKIIHWTDFKY